MRSSKSRSRSKSNRQRSPMGNIVNRVFDSSGPEGKVRGTPQQIIDKYSTLARDAQLSNDRVAAENFSQHAEHYTRLLGEAQRELEARREQNAQNSQNQQNHNQNTEQPRSDAQPSDPQPQPQDRSSNDRQPRRDRAKPEDQSSLDFVADDDSGLVETPEMRKSDPTPVVEDEQPSVAQDAADPKPRRGRGRPRKAPAADTPPDEPKAAE